ncbi:centrosomal protein of 78 kDa isoform X1 [Salmo salar]|uniref:Centrosomal protein of 78 kDa isoform X1 n=2 Tax=Salmo salar TaxID=8030 RepID=A0A1S3PJ23_SALSA|nr:centrosomal protein of 78 kDa isoform X1 [Salmo salar]
MLDTVQIRRRGAQDFESYYDYACAMQDSVPLSAVKANLSQGMLDFNGDRLKLTDWTPILNSLTINKQLQHVAVRSCYQSGLGIGEPERYRAGNRKKIPAIRSKEMTFKLCKALTECLTASPNLKTLQLHGLPFRERDLITLTKGLAKSVALENLSLAHCPIADEGLEAICQSVKYSPSIKTVDFTGCNLTWRGAEHMANIIKHQAMRRHSAAWAESLRYRRPEFEGMGGLRRVTLNCNTLVGDRGAAALAQELAEDLWVKALDLQKCGLSNDGTRSLLEALKSNSTLCVLDIRRNPLVDNDLMKSVIERVLMNANGQSSQYSWIKPPALKDSQKPPILKRRILGNTARGKATFRIGPRRLSLAGRRSPVVAQQPYSSSSRCIPWRTAERAGRQRGLPPGNTVAEQSFEGAATVKVTMETESEEEEEEEEGEEEAVETKSLSPLSLRERITVRQYRRVQVELEECRLRLAGERRARVKADTRLMEYELENARLRSINFSLSEALHAPATGPSSVLEDDAVLDSIESSFGKFHAFLDLLKDAGLGQLASMAGIDQSDFGPLGRPQLSSSVGRPLVGAGDQDTGDKVDAAPSGGDGPSASSEGQPNGFTTGAPATLRGFSPEGDPQKVPPVPASELASEPCVAKSGGENQQKDPSPSQPEGRQVSGTENSIHSNGSHGNDSYAKGSLRNDSQGSGSYGKGSRDRNVSHHSNGKGSHGYSFNYSNCSHAYSDSFHSNSSVRSSLSDMSERLESVGSLGSKASGGGRVGSGAQR